MASVGITTHRAVYRCWYGTAVSTVPLLVRYRCWYGTVVGTDWAGQRPWGSDNLFSRDSFEEEINIIKNISSFAICLFRFQH
jgi:hypothetical protein